MERALDGDFHSDLVGQLIQDDSGQTGVRLRRELVEQARRHAAVTVH